MSSDAEQHVAQIFERVDVVGFAAGDEGVEARDVVPGVFGADEEEILATEGDDAESSLGAIVIGRHARVVEEDGELGPLTECVADGDAELALGRVYAFAAIPATP